MVFSGIVGFKELAGDGYGGRLVGVVIWGLVSYGRMFVFILGVERSCWRVCSWM